MKVIGKEVHIQRGETWTLDFELQTESGHPYIIPKEYQNPYLVITVAGALYEQTGDFRRSYWLDLDRRDVEQADGSILEEPIKRFVSSTPLWLPYFAIDQVMAYYPDEIVTDPDSERDVTNFLFSQTTPASARISILKAIPWLLMKMVTSIKTMRYGKNTVFISANHLIPKIGWSRDICLI